MDDFARKAPPSEQPGARVYECERLARAMFGNSGSGKHEANFELLHPDAEIQPSFDPSQHLSARELRKHALTGEAPHAVESRGEVYHPLDDERIIVEGQVLLTRSGGGWDYRPTVWAVVFRDGRLYRSWCVKTTLEAEALLASVPGT